MANAELAERNLSFGLSDTSTRKQTGSYYTPQDVSEFFWTEFFNNADIDSEAAAIELCTKYKFVEPSVGAGALFFGLLYQLSQLNVSVDIITKIDITLVDINLQALNFIKQELKTISEDHDVNFINIKYRNIDFMEFSIESSLKPYFVFGNPPFIANSKKQHSRWKNLYADFLERSLSLTNDEGIVHMVVPLSLAFSRDYRLLRNQFLYTKKQITLSNFDNIPDALFKSGKPESQNSNKANSQRCSIFTISPSGENKVLSSKLLRWTKRERNEILSKSPGYFDVTDYIFDDQIPRPKSLEIVSYLNKSRDFFRLNQYISPSNDFKLALGGVARNYISFREQADSSSHILSFRDENDFLTIFSILSSDLFFDYWLTVGDGFHVTQRNILEFPLHPTLIDLVSDQLCLAKSIWGKRSEFLKSKQNSGKRILSYDFSNQILLTHHLKDII